MIVGVIVGGLVVLIAILAVYARDKLKGGVAQPVLAAGAGLVVLVLALVVLRYEIVAPSGDGRTSITFRLDRWTGDIVWCQPAQCQPVRWAAAD